MARGARCSECTSSRSNVATLLADAEEEGCCDAKEDEATPPPSKRAMASSGSKGGTAPHARDKLATDGFLKPTPSKLKKISGSHPTRSEPVVRLEEHSTDALIHEGPLEESLAQLFPTRDKAGLSVHMSGTSSRAYPRLERGIKSCLETCGGIHPMWKYS